MKGKRKIENIKKKKNEKYQEKEKLLEKENGQKNFKQNS